VPVFLVFSSTSRLAEVRRSNI